MAVPESTMDLQDLLRGKPSDFLYWMKKKKERWLVPAEQKRQGRGEKVNGIETVWSYPRPQRMDEGLARARDCGWELPCTYYKT